jgi:hypothetical protein
LASGAASSSSVGATPARGDAGFINVRVSLLVRRLVT